MPFGYPGARVESYARARLQPMRPVSPAGVLQSALERRVGGTRSAVGVDEAAVEAVTAAVAGAEPVVAVEPLDVLVVRLDHVEHELRAARLAVLVAGERGAEAREATGLGVPELRLLVLLAHGLDDARGAGVGAARLLARDAAVDLRVVVDAEDLRAAARGAGRLQPAGDVLLDAGLVEHVEGDDLAVLAEALEGLVELRCALGIALRRLRLVVGLVPDAPLRDAHLLVAVDERLDLGLVALDARQRRTRDGVDVVRRDVHEHLDAGVAGGRDEGVCSGDLAGLVDRVPFDEEARLLDVERLPAGVGEHLRALVADTDGDLDLRCRRRHRTGDDEPEGDEQRGEQAAVHEGVASFQRWFQDHIGTNERVREPNRRAEAQLRSGRRRVEAGYAARTPRVAPAATPSSTTLARRSSPSTLRASRSASGPSASIQSASLPEMRAVGSGTSCSEIVVAPRRTVIAYVRVVPSGRSTESLAVPSSEAGASTRPGAMRRIAPMSIASPSRGAVQAQS